MDYFVGEADTYRDIGEDIAIIFILLALFFLQLTYWNLHYYLQRELRCGT